MIFPIRCEEVDCAAFEALVNQPRKRYSPDVLAALANHWRECLFRETHTGLSAKEMPATVRAALAAADLVR